MLGFIFLMKSLPAQTLPEVVRQALHNNPDVRTKKSLVRQAELQACAAFRQTLPVVDFNASYRHITKIPRLDFSKKGISIPVTPINLGTFDTYETGISASYVLFNGFAGSEQVKIKKIQQNMANVQLRLTQKQVALQTIAAYRKVQSLLLQMESYRAARLRSEAQLNRMKSLAGQGMALAVDTLSLSLSRLNFLQKIIAAKSSAETAKQELQNIVGQPIVVAAFRDFNFKDIKLPQLHLRRDETIKRIRLQETIRKNLISIKKSAYFPSILLHASYKYGRPGADMINDKWMSYGLWGVSLNWNLFSWNADKLQSQAAESDLFQIVLLKEKATNRLQLRYQKNRREFKSLREQLKVIKQALALAQQKMNIINLRYTQGLASATDYTTANMELTQAEIKEKRHLLRMALKLNELEFVSGKPVNQWSINQ